MAFEVEDGTAKDDANSYVAVAEADSYFTDRGITTWTGADGVKQAALIKATDYIENRFSHRFVGSQATEAQALSWPRIDALGIDSDEIPVKLRKACCEYALRALVSGTLAPDPAIDTTGLTVVKTQKKVGPLETGFTVVGSTQPMAFRPYPAADALLKDLVYSSSIVIR